MSDSIDGLHWVLAIAYCQPIVWQSLKQIIAVSSVYPIVQLPMTTKQPLLNYVYTVGSLWLCSHYTGADPRFFLGGVHLSLALLQHQ